MSYFLKHNIMPSSY